MPRKFKATEPEAKPVESASEAPWGAKTVAIKQVLIANPTKSSSEIVELLKEQGFETTANYVRTMKTKLKGKRKKKAAPAPAPEAEAASVVPKDAVSIGLLQRAKKLAAQLGGIKEAKTAIDALAQILD
jgi:hypothetical protein